MVASDGYLPRSFANRGRRFVYSEGIWVLAILAELLVLLGGVTNRLISLFAVGAFLSLTLSPAGMVGHWRRVGGSGARTSMLVNGLGALATCATVVVVLLPRRPIWRRIEVWQTSLVRGKHSPGLSRH